MSLRVRFDPIGAVRGQLRENDRALHSAFSQHSSQRRLNTDDYEVLILLNILGPLAIYSYSVSGGAAFE
jgi:hypothetical protein